jgi:hypothetical protein
MEPPPSPSSSTSSSSSSSWSLPFVRKKSPRKLSLSLHKVARIESTSANQSPIAPVPASPRLSHSDRGPATAKLLYQQLARRGFGDDDCPTCPLCRGAHVFKVRFWTAADAYIYGCATEATGVGGMGKTLCHWWFLWCDRPLDSDKTCAECGADRLKLRIEIREGRPGYWCIKCDSFR